MPLPTLFFGKPRKIVNEVNLKFRFYSQKPELSTLNLWRKPPIVYDLQTEKKQRQLILQNNWFNVSHYFQECMRKEENFITNALKFDSWGKYKSVYL